MRTGAPESSAQTTAQSGAKPASIVYLDQLRALGEELSAAMEAVGSNALERFEESVRRQELLCVGLRRLGRELPSDVPSGVVGGAAAGGLTRTGGAGTESKESLGERIRVAEASLRELNERYAALIEQTSESARLFAGLCRSYQAPYPGAAAATVGEPRISCAF